MFKNKLTAIVTAGLILGGSITAFAQPKNVYLKSKDSGETIYISYKDYIKGYASRNEKFMETMKKYDIAAISVKTGKSEKIIDFKGYVDDYDKGNIKNVDDYSDKEDSKKHDLTGKVKELHKDGTIGSEQVTPPDNNEGEKTDYIAISEARQKNDDEIVTINGVVTSIIGNNAFVQDETGGMYIYLGGTPNENIVSGNKVKITGPINTYNGLKQIKAPTEITLESSENKLPDAQKTTVSGIKPEHQGSRIKIDNLTIVSVGNADKKGAFSVMANDGTSAITIRVDSFLDPKITTSQFKVGSIVNITSCLSKFHESNQLMISNINEMEVTKEGDGEVPSQEGVSINKIQGKSHRSPLEGQNVTGVKGIVTAVSKDKYQDGFFMQNPNPDNDPATSEGIFVIDKGTSVEVGDEVLVNGTVKEVVNGLQKDCVPETVIESSKVSAVGHGNPLPEPVVIQFNKDLAKNIDDDKMTSFDVETDAIDYYESLEGMRVQIEDPVIVGADERYGEICVLAHNGKDSDHQRTGYNGIKAYVDDFNPEIITIDDVVNPIVDNSTKKFYDKNYKVSVGDEFNENIVGVMSSGFGKYKVLNTEKLPEITPGEYSKNGKEIASIKKDESKLTVASFNVENLSKHSGDRLQKIGKAIVTNLKSPDIVGLSEILDNDGEAKTDVVDASETYEALIAAIKSAGGPEYAYTDIAPEYGKDGGVPGGNIRVGYIYRKDKVTLVEKTKGDAKTAVTMTDDGLSVNPGRISPNEGCFNSSRKPLVAQFKYNGQDVFIIGNHLNSKRGDGSLFALNQPPVRGSEPQRHKQATLINDFVKEIISKKPDANVIALGDMNDYEFSETLNILKGNEMKNSVEKLDVNERYSYVYNGNSQILDNLLVSNNLYDNTEVNIVHINSQSTFEKLSDHDPILVQIGLGEKKELTDEESVTEAIKNLNLGDITKVKDNLTLSKKGINETTIAWTSDKPDVVSNEGVVVRPENGKGNVAVKLTATVTKGEVTQIREFDLTVLEKEKEGEIETPEVGEEKELAKADTSVPEGWQATGIGESDKYIQLSTNTSCLITPAMNLNSYTDKTLTFDARTYGGIDKDKPSNEITISVSLDDGATWEVVKKVSPVDKNILNQGNIDLSKYTGDKVKVKFETLNAVKNKGVGICKIVVKGK